MTPNREHKGAGSVGGGRWKRISRWLKAHKKTVTILSALTVLTSFVVKETLDEPAKDLLTLIAAAEGDNNQEQAGMYNQLTNINKNLEIVKDRVVEDRPVDAVVLERRTLRAGHTKILELIGENIGHLVVLKNILPPSFTQDEEKFEQKYQSLGFPGDEASVDALRKSTSEWQALYDESRILRGQGVRALMELRERTEFDHRMYLWIAYVSFALGWVVGLFSNLAGGKADSQVG